MKICDINPFVRYARVHKYAEIGNKKEISICYDCRIFFVINASGNVFVNGEEYNISNKMALYFPPRSEYIFNFGESENINIIVIDFDMTNEFSNLTKTFGVATKESYNPKGKPKYKLPEELKKPIIRHIPQIENTLLQCTEKILLKNTFFGEEASALLKMCIIELLKENFGGIYSSLCENVISFIHENYADTTLSNEIIAKKFGYHPYHLSKIIKNETGKSLHQYLIYYRIHIAKNLLITTKYALEEIAWKSGFASSAYFIKIFRENTGITPKKYRQIKLHAEL